MITLTTTAPTLDEAKAAIFDAQQVLAASGYTFVSASVSPQNARASIMMRGPDRP